MKRLILTLCIALVSVCTFAQAGEKSVGVNISYGTKISNIGFGVKGRYNFTDHIRAEASFDYFLEKDLMKMWDVNLNAHYLFPVAEKFKVYPLVGLTYTHWNIDYSDDPEMDDIFKDVGLDESDEKESDNEFGVNLGAGVQYDINDAWAVNFELKYQIISHMNQAVFSLGIVYKF